MCVLCVLCVHMYVCKYAIVCGYSWARERYDHHTFVGLLMRGT